MKKPRLIATVAVIAAVIITVLGIPLPFHVNCTFEVSPLGAESVFPGVPGRLSDVAVKPGDVVTAGETVLARLDNIDLVLQVEKLKGELAELKEQRSNLHRQRFVDTRVAMQLPAVVAMIETVEKQLRDETEKLGRLEIIAPVSGTVFPPPVKPHRETHDGRLPGWSGSPFHAKNRGAVLQEADQFCQIGDANRFEAVLVIDQADIDLVRQYWEQHNDFPTVEMKLDAYRWTTSEGQIVKVASAPMEVTPVSLASQGGGELSAKTDRDGLLRPISTSFQARVPLENSEDLLRVGLTGQARVYTGWQPLGRRMYRYLARTFRFDW